MSCWCFCLFILSYTRRMPVFRRPLFFVFLRFSRVFSVFLQTTHKLCILYNLTRPPHRIAGAASNYRAYVPGVRHKTTCKQFASARFVYNLFSPLQNSLILYKKGRAGRASRLVVAVSLTLRKSFTLPPLPVPSRESAGSGRGGGSAPFLCGLSPFFVVFVRGLHPPPARPQGRGRWLHGKGRQSRA